MRSEITVHSTCKERPQIDVDRLNYDADRSMREGSELPPPLDNGGGAKYKYWISSSLVNYGDDTGNQRNFKQVWICIYSRRKHESTQHTPAS